MISILQVSKRFGTYADTVLALGLASLAKQVQKETQEVEEIQLRDEGTHYQIQFKEPVDSDEIATLDYWQLFPPVQGSKTDMSEIPLDCVAPFDTVKHSEERKRYRDWKYQGGKKLDLGDDAPEPADPRTQNGVILTSMRHDRNHNDLWKSCWELKNHFGALAASILQAFTPSETTLMGSEATRIAELFKQRTRKALPAPASAVKLFMPTAVQGVNRLKADSNKSSDSQKDNWVLLWLIACGLFEFGLSERIKINDNTYDWRTVVLEPKDISLFRYGEALDELRKVDPPSGGHGIARFDAELALKFCQKLLNHYPVNEPQTLSRMQRFRGRSVKAFVSGFRGTHFGSKGQVYGVKDIFSLGLPDWIRPESSAEVDAYQDVLQEHLLVVRSISAEEGHSELIAAYRDFITSSDLNQFFRFHTGYADYLIKQLADPTAKFSPPRFSQEGLDTMTQSFHKSDQEWSITEITQNPGFQRVARAINSATVYAGKIKTREGMLELDWQRTYGLAQRLSNQAGSKRDFVTELTAFLTSYENENLRLSEQLQKDGKSLKRVWVTNEDLEQFLALLDDKRFSCNLVANLLLAYGYAKWKKPLVGEPVDIPVDVDDETNNTEETP